MMIRRGLLASALVMTLAAGAAYAADSSTMRSTQAPSSLSQTTGQSTSSASQISLTQQQKKDLFQAASNMPQQNEAGSLMPGSKGSASGKLSAISSSPQHKA